jgi:hypothetical protein
VPVGLVFFSSPFGIFTQGLCRLPLRGGSLDSVCGHSVVVEFTYFVVVFLHALLDWNVHSRFMWCSSSGG